MIPQKGRPLCFLDPRRLGSRPQMNRSKLLAVLFLSFGCSKLTEPPKPEPVQGETTTTTNAEAKPEGEAKPAAEPKPAAPAQPPPDPNAKLEIKDVAVGKGAEAKAGDTVKVHYVGTLTNGDEFDASKKHGNEPFTFELGKGRVIKGWDDGVAGMKEGGKRKLVIPPHLGYGARGAGGKIPPNSTLLFEVELIEVVKKK
jgi:FKBP-type peptidyl-prolyl cis-trans isomerase FkpA